MSSTNRKNYNYEVINATQPMVRSEDQKQIEEICRPLHISNKEAHLIERGISLSIEQGLQKSKRGSSSIKCYPTYVTRLPDGKETGKYLALDLGGTNFRIILVELMGDAGKPPKMKNKLFKIPEDIMRSEVNHLFEYIAEKIKIFLHDENLAKEKLKVGFTFSFPCDQVDLASGTLTKWTKGFDCPYIVGKDVCALLNEALLSKGVHNVEISALLNDSTGCLISCAWRDPRCRVGLIVGTGSNACYLESIDKVELMENTPVRDDDKYVIINTEWGAFGEFGELDFILTNWDRKVDECSLNPGQHIFEKIISGMYMGEIVRQVLLELADKDLIFPNLNLSKLKQQGSFHTKHVCDVEHDPVGSFERCRQALKEVLGTEDEVREQDCYTVRYVCEEVSRRSCMLLAAGISGLLKRMDYKDVVIAVDGTLFRKHPLFYIIMKKKITQLMGIEYKFDMIQTQDGSGLGAAIIAAVMSKDN